MFESLILTGLRPFLEESGPILTEDVKAFFRSACIRGNYIVSTVRDHTFWLDEAEFATLFNLPTEGFSDFPPLEGLDEFYYSLLFSGTMEPVEDHGPKNLLGRHAQLLLEIVTRFILCQSPNQRYSKNTYNMMTNIFSNKAINWSTVIFQRLKSMVITKKGLGFAPHISKLILSYRPEFGPGTPAAPSNILNKDSVEERISRMKQPAPGSRKKKADKKTVPAKEKAESKGKEKVTFSEPPQQTEDEESASNSERTDTERTDDERSANEEEHSGQSPNNAGPDANPETTEGSEEGGEDAGDEGGDKDNEETEEAEADRISLKLLQGAKRRAESIEELYLKWHEHRFGKPYSQILPGYTDVECLQRLKEVEDLIMDLTNSNTIEEVLHRTYLLKPQVQLRKLTTRIRKITEEFEEVGPEDTLTPRVLERLEKAKGDLIQEIDRLEAIYSQREIPVYTAPRIETSPDHCPTPPRENAASKESDERADPLLTGQSPPTQPEVSESDFTKEWVEGRLQRFEASTTERIDSRIQEFEDSAVQPFKDRFQRIVCSALKFADTTRYLLNNTRDRLSEIDEDQQEEAALRSKYFKRTVILEDTTSELKEDFGRLERETDQRLAEVAQDLVGTTLGRVSELEKKNAGLEDELKALSAQVTELLQAKINADAAAIEANAQAAKKVQDELDAEASKEKEAPRSSQLTEEEEEVERIRKAEAKFPGLTKKAVAQAEKDAARLERERRRLESFTEDNKKKKAASSVSAPKKRKREPSKKVQIADLLNEVTETVISSIPQQAAQVEEEVEEQLQPRSTRQRVSEPASRPQPEKKRRNIYDFSDSE
ncbi:cingulin-like [Impatiens glandulifera]|uniref:cingulin-like n=1 Tax=Impatiens glandulifera TaxID=253017 RepID=UPI001FB0B1C4|nr:cingulin-like [Impatiens glandulifera]